jgi:TonB-dependent receptor
MIIAGALFAAPAFAQDTGSSGETTAAQAAASAQASTSTGAITGTVTNETGETNLEGALVRIEELGRETSTDREGRFGFSDVAPGTYNVTVTYFGAAPFGAQVTVATGESAALQLRPTQAGQEIVVTGIRGNISASRSRERSSDVLQSVISADAAGEFGDQNLAESLQRAPGVSIIRSEGEGTLVSIRGLAPQFTKVTVDGVQLGATGDGRESSLDTISSDLASAITVSKYQLPDQPADAIGGTVNIEGLSAFDRGGFSLNLRAEGSYQEESEKISPILSASTTFLTGIFGGEDNLGISLAGNWSQRKLAVDVIDGDQPPYLYQDRAGDVGYVPDKIILQRELAKRTRWGLSGGLEFRPTDQDEVFFRATYAHNRDLDQAYIQEWDIDNSQGGTRGVVVEVPDIDGSNFILADADVLLELSHQPETDKLYTLTFGGEHTRGDWLVDYQGYFSHRKIFKDNFIKGEWREQNVLVAGSTTPDGYEIGQITLDEIRQRTGLPNNQLPTASGLSDGNINNPVNFEQIQVQTEEGLRDDKVWSAKANVQRNFLTAADREGYFKAGLSYLGRDQMRDRDRQNYNPTNAVDRQRICGSTSATNACVIGIGSRVNAFDLSIPKNSLITIPMPTFGQVVPFFNDQAEQFLPLATFGTARDDVLTAADDYDAHEEVYAGYVMGQVAATDQLTVTGGVRVEHTKFRSNGFLTVNNEGSALEGDPGALVFVAPLGEATNSYTDFFPSLLLRYEPSRDLVIRAAYSTSTLRPSFNQTRNSIVSEDDFASDDAGTPNDTSDDTISTDLGLRLGRPDLDPYFSHNFDLSLAYYPNRSTVLSVAGFYKKVKNFIVDAEFTNITLAELGFLDLPQVGQFTFDPNLSYSTIETTINGDSATVYGVEFDFAHTANWLPEPFDNIFVQGNATIAKSKSAVGDLREESIPLVGQADLVANLSIGYEDKSFTARVSGNYSGERLAELGSTLPVAQRLDPDSPFDRFGDLYIESYLSVDVSLRYRVTKQIQLSFDAININNESDDINYKRSDRNYFSEREIYGRTFKAGVRVSF